MATATGVNKSTSIAHPPSRRHGVARRPAHRGSAPERPGPPTPGGYTGGTGIGGAGGMPVAGGGVVEPAGNGIGGTFAVPGAPGSGPLTIATPPRMSRFPPRRRWDDEPA